MQPMTIETLSARLERKFKNVPNVDTEDLDDWIATALDRHGVRNGDPRFLRREEVYLVLLLAQSEGAMRIALDTAFYFRYQDGDEMVDKSEVSEQWRRLSNNLETDYRRQMSLKQSSTFRVAKRLDR